MQTPTLAMIVEREDKTKNFIKEPFYTVEITGDIDGAAFTVASGKFKDKTEAENVLEKCNGKTAVVKSVIKQEKSTSAPKLYDLTTLQREANRLFGYLAKQTLEYSQNLYERKIITYPRTDSRFLTEDMQNSLPSLVASVRKYMPMFSVDTDDKNSYGRFNNIAQVVNNSKVTDHHAIIPTLEAANVNLDSASGEKNILMMVAARLLSAVSSKHSYAETVIAIEFDGCEGIEFTAKGKTVIDNG